MTICELKQRTRLSEWRTAIQQQKASGQSIKQWCEENNCGEGKYYYWLKQVRQEMLEQGSASTVALVQFEPERLPVAAMEISTQKSPLQAAATETPTQKSPLQATDNILIHYGKACVELPKTTVATDVAQLLKLLCHD
ncbi:MAG: hypothetical protein RSE58_02215 [Clostridia bacterium]